MKRIKVLTTGGTIAMTFDEETKGVKPKDPQILQQNLAYFTSFAEIEMEHIFNLPSPHITPNEMYILAKRIEEVLNQPETDGVVVTHGTDILEETAYYLHLTVPNEKPIVVTGAMRSLDELGADGPYNLRNAIRVAAHPRAGKMGTLVVFNDDIHSAEAVTKAHTSNVATFQSPGTGPLGLITKDEILFYRTPERPHTFPLVKPDKQVILLKAVSGMDDSLIHWAIDRKVDGIVIEAFGQGNLPPMMVPGIQRAISQNIPVVLVSRCYYGFVQDTYSYEGGGKQLKEMGVIFASGLNGQKARLHLMAALQVTNDITKLQQYF
jgi:L-asparaginase